MKVAVREEPQPLAATETSPGAASAAAAQTLVERCRAGDQAAWRLLYDQNLPLVYRLARRMGAGERETADICQEVFVRVFRSLTRFRGEAQISTWIYRITVNEVSRHLRAGALRRALSLGGLLAHEPVAPQPGPDRLYDRVEAATELEGILSRMKPKKRMVFVLHEFEEMTTEEIASVLECSVETVKSRLRHAREEFRRYQSQRKLVVMTGGRT